MELKVKVTKQDLKLAAVAKSNDYREYLQQLIYRNGHWFASNGFMLAYSPAVVDQRNDKLPPETEIAIPVNIAKQLKPSNLVINDNEVKADQIIARQTGYGRTKLTEYSLLFKQGEKGLTRDMEALFTKKDSDVTTNVTLGVDVLKKLLAAVGDAAEISLRIVTNREAPIEFKTGEGGVGGLFMPMLQTQDDWSHPNLNLPKPDPKKEEKTGETVQSPGS